MKIDTKKIAEFMRGLNKAEYHYVDKAMGMAGNIRKIQRDYNVSDTRMAALLDIDEELLPDYQCGAHNYDLNDMARLNAAYVELEHERQEMVIEDNVPVKMS